MGLSDENTKRLQLAGLIVCEAARSDGVDEKSIQLVADYDKERDAALLAQKDEELVEGLAHWMFANDRYNAAATGHWQHSEALVKRMYRENARTAIQSARKR
jgi:hypothetical protein